MRSYFRERLTSLTMMGRFGDDCPPEEAEAEDGFDLPKRWETLMSLGFMLSLSSDLTKSHIISVVFSSAVSAGIISDPVKTIVSRRPYCDRSSNCDSRLLILFSRSSHFSDSCFIFLSLASKVSF